MNKNERNKRLICAYISALTSYQNSFDKLKEIKNKMEIDHAIRRLLKKLSSY